MSFWITMKRGRETTGFSTDTAAQALEQVEKRLREAWEQVRIIDHWGAETDVQALRLQVDKVES